MIARSWLVPICAVVIFTGCGSMQLSKDFQTGRESLLNGNHSEALAYFHRVAQTEPNYVYGTALRQNVWSYVGRAEYGAGRYEEARRNLEKAFSPKLDNDISILYLGLALARSGDRERGIREIERGMRGAHEWLEYITEAHRSSFGQFWDPRREIRSAIESDLAMLSGKEIDWQKLIADGEWVGKRLEEEGDLARRDEGADLDRDGDDGRP